MSRWDFFCSAITPKFAVEKENGMEKKPKTAIQARDIDFKLALTALLLLVFNISSVELRLKSGLDLSWWTTPGTERSLPYRIYVKSSIEWERNLAFPEVSGNSSQHQWRCHKLHLKTLWSWYLKKNIGTFGRQNIRIYRLELLFLYCYSLPTRAKMAKSPLPL